MSAQPEALRLAEFYEALAEEPPKSPDNSNICAAAAELRRLHQFAEDQIGRATAAEAALQMTKATHALKIAAVEAQRDALLVALKLARPYISTYTLDGYHAEVKADAAIKAVEGEKA